jgi:hypothetical protein
MQKNETHPDALIFGARFFRKVGAIFRGKPSEAAPGEARGTTLSSGRSTAKTSLATPNSKGLTLS